MAIVLDPNYAERVVELARERHVWLVTSASNDPAVRALWDDPAYSLEEKDDPLAEGGVTTFSPAETPEASFISILEESRHTTASTATTLRCPCLKSSD